MNAIAIVGAEWGHAAAALAGVPVITWLGDMRRCRYAFALNWSAGVDVDSMSSWEWVNFHCSDLRFSYGRGGHPIENMILRGHDETVIAAHKMTSEIDAGPVYGVRGPVSLAGTKSEIQQRFIEPVAELMRWIIETNPEPQPQVGEPVYFKRLSSDAYAEFWRQRG